MALERHCRRPKVRSTAAYGGTVKRLRLDSEDRMIIGGAGEPDSAESQTVCARRDPL
jgi:hypothetical protein